MPKKDKSEISVLVNEMKGRMQDLRDHKKKRLAIEKGFKQAAKQLLRRIKSESRIVLKDHNSAKDVTYECVGIKWFGCDPLEDHFCVVLEIGYMRRRSDKICFDDVSPEVDEIAVKAELAMLQRKLCKELQLKVIVHLQPAYIQDDQVDPPGLY